jgi:hypothetical protein
MAKSNEKPKPLVLPKTPVFVVSTFGPAGALEDGYVMTESDAVKVATSDSRWSNGNQVIEDIWALPLNELVTTNSAVRVYGRRYYTKRRVTIWSRLDKPLSDELVASHKLRMKFESSKLQRHRAKIPEAPTLVLAQGTLPGKRWWNKSRRMIGLFSSEEEAIRKTPYSFRLEQALADGSLEYVRKLIRGKFSGGYGYAEGHGKTDPHYKDYVEAKRLHGH